jgi:predicted AlkP superfamily phosphohydrolase/phosphomutase
MTGRARILFVGLDACDPAIALGLAAEGQMPALAKLLGDGGRGTLTNPFGLFVGALWMTFATGLRPDRHRFMCWDEIDIDSYRRRLTNPAKAAGLPFWQALSAAGRRVAVLDVPHSRAAVPVRGLQIAEWGCHDRHFGFHSWPAGEAGRIERAYGLHPVFGIDAYATREFAPDDYAHRAHELRRPEEERALLEDLLRGVETKGKLSADLLAAGGWDLFLTVFGESHAVGHQQWHLHDAGHPRFDPAATRVGGGDPLARVYGRLDAALGALLSLVDGRTTVFLMLSHGMGAHNDGTQLLDETLHRLDLVDRPSMPGGWAGDLLDRGVLALSDGRAYCGLELAEATRRRAARGLPRRCREFVRAGERARQRYFSAPNNFVYGGVRLNLMGREPRGRVRPEDADGVMAQLAQDLLALVNLDTGRPAIRRVERADRWYRRSARDSMPDLFIDWEREAPIETLWSPKLGLLHAPYVNWRSGDHRPDGLLVAAGPGISKGELLPDVLLEDLAPSIAARLDVALDDIDGRPVEWLSGRQSADMAQAP